MVKLAGAEVPAADTLSVPCPPPLAATPPSGTGFAPVALGTPRTTWWALLATLGGFIGMTIASFGPASSKAMGTVESLPDRPR